ncbi:FluG domain-containing protein [Podospora appendiculata]|uniref:FluG domain-containing protein n=1 Tax=Podospora appendiculata TaxID=314037 RepID=A0AAE1C841_9PEZI|nr:FluG domain-containing protein [Podospora appendiculata]
MPARCPPQPLAGRSADFVRQFTAKQKRIAKQPKALTADQREALLKQLEVTQFLQPDYADGTKINIAGVLRKWKRYCAFINKGHWQDVIKDADRARAMVFLDYICETYRIKSWGTSWQYFRLYKQLYASVTGRIHGHERQQRSQKANAPCKWHDAILVPKYNIQPPCSHGKDVANADTLLVLLTFNIRYDTGIFPWEGHRVQLPGCYLGLAFTGARPAEFVDREKRGDDDECLKEIFSQNAIRSIPDDENRAPDEHSRLLEDMISQEYEGRGRPKALCYEDILLMVVRHPETGKDILAMSIRLAHHKGMDNNPKPTIFFFTPTRRLIFCFISVIVSLAVYDRAFAVSKFTSVREVFQARNRGPVKCTPLRWKEEWLKRPVFRQYIESIAEEESDERKYQPLPYRRLHYDMERQSLDAGEENKIEPKAWRRGAANAADGNASDAVRDQMMRHDPKWATFNSAYINEKVGFHLQNAFLEEPTEDGLLAMLSHIGLMRDPRASKDMVPDEVWELMPPDPQIEALKAERARLRGGRYRIKGSEHEGKIRELTKLIATKEQQRKTAIRRDYRKHYFHNRPTWDMEADGQEEEEYVEPTIDLQIPERAQLAEILCNQPDNLSSAELLELRIRATELMVILCGKRETLRPDRIRRRVQVQADVAVKEESPELDPFPLLMDMTQCPCCIGDQTLSQKERTFKYCRPAVMYDHFDRKHARQLDSVKQMSCNHLKCKEEALEFKHLNHFKNHVESVHGVKLRA